MAKDKKTKKAKKMDGIDALIHSAVCMADRLQVHLKRVPDGYNFENPKSMKELERVTDAVLNIYAIEEEWMLDEDVRRELSVIQQLPEEDDDE